MPNKSVLTRMFCGIAVLALLPSVLASCSGGSAANTSDTSDADSMTIQYVGNSCFYIRFSDGTCLVADPYPGMYDKNFAPFPDIDADIVFATHNHADHNAYGRVADKPIMLKPGDVLENRSFNIKKGETYIVTPEAIYKTIKIGPVEITGYSSSHVLKMGKNTVFVVKYRNLKAVHMGETDKIESQEALDAIKDADVIFLYMGNLGEAKNDEILAFAAQMNVKAIIPQHYSMASSWYNEPFIEDIIEGLPEDMELVNTDKIIVEKGMKKRFVVLSAMGNAEEKGK